MTITYPGVTRSLQLTGLLLAGLGTLASLLAGSGYDMLWGGAGLLVLGANVIAIRSRSIPAAIVAVALEWIVLGYALVTKVGGRPVEITRLIDPDVGATLLFISTVPTVLGVVNRWLSR